MLRASGGCHIVSGLQKFNGPILKHVSGVRSFIVFGACILGGVPVVGNMFWGDFGATYFWWRASGVWVTSLGMV